jgi:YYY domain-containing protein
MKEAFFFWISIEAIGLAAFPLAFAFFHRLPDRGYAFTKVIGLLLISYALWMGATVGIFPNTRGSIVLLLVALATVSLVVGKGKRQELRAFLANGWKYIVFVEGLFLVVFATAVYIRSFAPEIVWGEKPFELAFVNSINRSEFFPPRDPWLSGSNISYYYFGFVQAAGLTKLSGLGTNVTFYLMLSLVAALSAVTVFGVVYNLIAWSRSHRETAAQGPALAAQPDSTTTASASYPLFMPRAAVFGLIAVGLLLLVSNLVGVFELLARYGIGSRAFYDWVGIFGLNEPYDCAAHPEFCREWYPTPFWWWWKATRMASGFDIQEFPFFSFQFGDLHPHVVAIPFTITIVGAAFQLFLSRDSDAFDWRWWFRRPWSFLLLALLIGGLAFTDLWALPTFMFVVAAAVFLANWARQRRLDWRVIGRTLAFVLPLAIATIVLYLPFYATLKQGASGAAINQAWLAEVRGFPPLDTAITRPVHFLEFWIPMLWLPVSFLAVYHFRRRRQPVRPWMVAFSVFPWLMAATVWALFILLSEGLGGGGQPPAGFLGEITTRWSNFNWLTLLMLMVFLTASLLALARELARPSEEGSDSHATLFLFTSVAFLLVLGAELFFVFDKFEFRINTVFRFWYQAWMLLAVAGAYGLYQVTAGWPLRINLLSLRWAARLAWVGLTASVFAAALVYTVLVTFERTNGFDNPRQGLDGFAFLLPGDSGEYAAIQWLNENVKGTPTILEAQGGGYSDYARISSRTGIPTVLGWSGHEFQWRGSAEPYEGRAEDIERIYTTNDIQEAKPLLEKYDVEYVYVGRLEKTTYVEDKDAQEQVRTQAQQDAAAEGLSPEEQTQAGDAAVARFIDERNRALQKFEQFMKVVFQQDNVTIYQMPQVVEDVGHQP